MERLINSARNRGMAWAALWFGSCLFGVAAEVESPATVSVPLEYREVAFSVIGTSLPVASQTVPFKKEPQAGKNVKRGRFNLPGTGSDSVAFLWDYRKLYLDLNRNEDLTDDPGGVFTSPEASSASLPAGFHYGNYNKVPLTLRLPEGQIPWLVDLNLSEYGTSLSAYASVRSFWAGKAVLNGREFQVGWIPTTDRRPGANQGERLVLRDWGERDTGFYVSEGSLDTFSFPKKLFVQNTGYELGMEHAERDGKLEHRILFKEQPAELGDLSVSGRFVQRVLLTDGPCVAVIDAPEGTVRVPVGRYGNHYVQLGKGKSLARLKDSPHRSVTIAAATPAKLVAGGPLTNSATLTRQNDFLVLGYELLGAGGESYELATRDYQHPPRFTAYEGSRKVGAGNFEFG